MSLIQIRKKLLNIETIYHEFGPPADVPPDGAAETAPTTQAESPDAGMEEARRRYAQGSEFYRRGRFAEAVKAIVSWTKWKPAEVKA